MTIPGRRGSEGRTEVLSFPSADQAFARQVRASVAGAAPASPEDLQGLLRERFPRAVVRRRVLSGESWVTWYAFRDGTALPMVRRD